jgi:hypothetical protein
MNFESNLENFDETVTPLLEPGCRTKLVIKKYIQIQIYVDRFSKNLKYNLKIFVPDSATRVGPAPWRGRNTQVFILKNTNTDKIADDIESLQF